MKKLLSAAIAFFIIVSLSASPAFAQSVAASSAVVPERIPDTAFDGIWEGSFPVFSDKNTYFNDIVTIDIMNSRKSPVLLKINSMYQDDVYVTPGAWQINNGVLTMEMYEGSWYSVATLTLKDNKMTGTYRQRGHQMQIDFERTSLEPSKEEKLNTVFMYDGKTGEEWRSKLKEYPEFKGEGQDIPFQYSLYRWDKSLPMITVYGLKTVMDGRSDVDVMAGVLDIINSNFKHNGSIALSSKMDPLSVIASHNEHGGIECRGLSIILAEMLRTCGIEAKPIMCISSEEPSECHVVVHAYSKSLKQWIMLDPTYQLMLKNSKGQYLDLPMLRKALIDGEQLFANDEANYNGNPFYIPYYKGYMSKNTFRFACATNFYFGGEKFADTDVKGETTVKSDALFGSEAGSTAANGQTDSNPFYMLVPNGYKVPYINSRKEKITLDANSFWAVP